MNTSHIASDSMDMLNEQNFLYQSCTNAENHVNLAIERVQKDHESLTNFSNENLMLNSLKIPILQRKNYNL